MGVWNHCVHCDRSYVYNSHEPDPHEGCAARAMGGARYGVLFACFKVIGAAHFVYGTAVARFATARYATEQGVDPTTLAVLATTLLGVVALVLDKLNLRPSKQVSERLDGQDKEIEELKGRVAALETWKNG